MTRGLHASPALSRLHSLRRLCMNNQAFFHSVVIIILQNSFLKASLRSLLLVGESAGASTKDLLGEGKRSRYTVSSAGQW